MKKYIVLILASCMCVIGIVIAVKKITKEHKQKNTAERLVSDAEIKKSIAQFAALLDDSTYKDFGFTSTTEVNSFKATYQFKYYTLVLEDIVKYKNGDNLYSMIKGFPVIQVALTDNTGQIRTSIKFLAKGDHWDAIGFGFTPEMATLADARDSLPNAVLMNGNLVKVPSFETSFLFMPNGAGMDFYILDKSPVWAGLKPGKKMEFKEAMLQFIPRAYKQKSIDSLYH